MKLLEFINIVEEPDHDKLKEGVLFMDGKSMISQKTSKKVGDWVTYYKVTGKKGRLIEYEPVSVKLEGD
jgi:hypothetical protein